MSKDSEKQMPKPVAVFSYKGATTSGDLTKTYVWVHDNGVVSWVTHILSADKEGWIDCKVVTERFGKRLYRRESALKYSSLQTIFNATTEALVKSKVPIKDIL